jgi:5-formyltetrahydrofolate cyclo-ligase
MPGSVLKAQIRERIWERMTHSGIALFPGAYGRTPTFRGQEEAAERLRATELWQRAQRVLVLGEPVLAPVREAAADDGKVIVVPDLSCEGQGWMFEVDPRALAPEQAHEAARFAGSGAARVVCATCCLRGKDVAPVDLMVIGAVGVDRRGNRVGRGLGGADLVYALGRDRGFLAAETPVVVLVHPLQFFDEPTDREPTDLPVDYIVTPAGIIRIETVIMRPKGLHPSMVTPRRMEAFPGLRQILEREGIPLPGKHPGDFIGG